MNQKKGKQAGIEPATHLRMMRFSVKLLLPYENLSVYNIFNHHF